MTLLRAHWRTPALLAVAALAITAPTVGQLPAATAAPGDVAFASSFEANQPPPTWVSTPEGTKSSGVTGPAQVGIPGDITATNTGVTASAENAPNEIAAKAVDGDENSKWLAFASTGWLRVGFAAGVTVKRYALTSANDSPERDPRDWQVQGSNDNGATWTTVDSKTGQSFDQRFQTKVFDVANTTAYAAYRLNVTANQSGDIIQLAEFRLSDGSPAVPPSGPMVAEVGSGPTSAYNAKTGVGFTGLKALRYAGLVTGAAGGKAWDKVYDVDIPVGAKTELSYRIFPELTKGDLRYPSTYASVDLAFTDGTYLSDLTAVDQLGFGMSPRAQGASKALYANQWNPRSALDRWCRRRQDHRPHPRGLRQPGRSGRLRRVDRRPRRP